MTRPLGSKALVELDPDKDELRGLFLPDLDTIKICRKCERRQENLGDRCTVPSEIFEENRYEDRPEFRGLNWSHEIEAVQAPRHPVGATPGRSSATFGTIRAIGPKVEGFSVGDRVVVCYTAGVGVGNLRVVNAAPDGAILALVEAE